MMRRLIVGMASVMMAAALVVANTPAHAEPDSSGSDLWLMFNENLTAPDLALTLFVTGDVATVGTVSGPSLPDSIPFNVTPGAVTSVSIDVSQMVATSDVVESKGLYVSASEEITVYGLNQRAHSTDAFLGLPVDALGTNYVILDTPNTVAHGEDAAQFGVVGTVDGTVVTVTPAESVSERDAGVGYTVTLNAGDTYQLQNTGGGTASLTGTTVSATSPIAVFAGNRCTNIPGGTGDTACDHNVEQLFPDDTWGTNFITTPLATRTAGDTYRFVAGTNGTEVFVDGNSVGTFDRGESYETILTGSHSWEGTEPIMLAQYSNSSTFDGVTSDPFMMLIPPYEQFRNRYTVSTPPTGIDTNYVNIVARDSSLGAIALDGVAIPASDFSAIGGTGFSGAQVRVAVGAHRLEGSEPFGAYSYGFASYDSYGYPGGLGFARIATDTDGDALPDSWETEGLDYDRDGVVDIDLPAMGADPNVRDIFIEVDWMEKPNDTCILWWCWGARSFAPMQAALEDVAAAFASAPGGPIRLHVDAGPDSTMNPVDGSTWGAQSRANSVGYTNVLGSTNADGTYNWGEFDSIRIANFEAARGEVFHYVLYADRYQGFETTGSSGLSRGIPGGHLIVTDGAFNRGAGFTRVQERGTFMHELGHNLDLYHGGGPTGTRNYDSAYHSIMNYAYQLVGLPPGQQLDYSGGLPYDDWANLRFDGGLVGALGDVAPLPTATPDDSLTYEEAVVNDVLAVPGDGTVAFVGPSALLPDTGERSLLFDVTNPSNETATYMLAIATDLPTTPTSPVTIGGSETVRVAVNVVTEGLSPGDYALTVQLSSDLAGDGLSIVDGSVTVPDPSQPGFEEDLASALAVLEDISDPELDLEVLQDVIDQIETATTQNSSPSVAAGDDVSGIEGSAIALAGSAEDLDDDPIEVHWTYALGAGVDTGATCTFSNGSAIETTITCTDDGQVTVTVSATDGANPAVSDMATVTVANADPTAVIETPQDGSTWSAGATVELYTRISDAGVNDSHTCEVDWGDGTVENGPASTGSCSASHTYAPSAGPAIAVAVTVTDDDGGATSTEVTLNPPTKKVRVTGGGFVVDRGRTMFGFIARAKASGVLKGNIVIVGPGRSTFVGSSLESLVVTGDTATWAGSGLWNRESGYTYSCTAVVDGSDGSWWNRRRAQKHEIACAINDADGEAIYSFGGRVRNGFIRIR